MKTLLQNNRDYLYDNNPAYQLEKQNLNEVQENNFGPPMIVKPLRPKLDRITSAHVTSKIIKGIQPKQQSITNGFNDFQIVGSQMGLKSLEPKGLHKEDITYSLTKTENQGLKFMIKATQEPDNRAQTAPENKKVRPTTDFKNLVYQFKIPPLPQQQQEIDFQEPLYKVEETNRNPKDYNINRTVHTHLQRLKSSVPLNRNQSSSLVRKKELIEKQIQNVIRPVQSQQQLKRKIILSGCQNNDNERPKTSIIKQSYQIGQSEHKKQVKFGSSATLANHWLQLTQKVADTQQNQNEGQEFNDLDNVPTKMDLNTNTLTAQEREYIKIKKNQYLEEIRPYIQVVQMQAQHQKQQQQKMLLFDNSNAQKQNSFLSNFDTPVEIVAKEDSFDMLEDDLFFDQQPMPGQKVNSFFHDAESINNSFLVNLKEAQHKLVQLQAVDDRLQLEREEIQRNQPEKFLNVDSNVSTQEVGFVLREFAKHPDQRNYELLDSIAKKLSFFYKFSKQTRILLLRLANIVHYEGGEYIFRQDDEGDLMYIILRGACHVRVQNSHMEEHPVVVTLYDGQQFGELALIDTKDNKSKVLKANVSGKGEMETKSAYTMKDIRREMKEKEQEQEQLKNWWKKGNEQGAEQNDSINAHGQAAKRSASIETAEATYLLTISRDYFQTILLNLITQELEDKLKTLLVLPCFDFMSPMTLIPIANLMEQRTYKLGEVVLKEGSPQKYFYIIAKGRCKIIKEETFIRDTKILGISKKLKKKKFNFGIIDCNSVIMICVLDQTINKPDKPRARMQTNNNKNLQHHKDPDHPKSFQYEEIFKNQDYMAFKYHFHYGDFVRGDYFMGRALMSEYKKLEPSLNDLPFDTDESSRLTIISDAAVTEIYLLEKSMIHVIPYPLKKMLMEGVMMKKEFDHFFTAEEAERVKKWDHYKTDLFRWALDVKHIKKNQD